MDYMERKIGRRALLIGLGVLVLALIIGIVELVPGWLDPEVKHGYGSGVYGFGLYGEH
jgi:hypothetical protein